MNIKHLPLIDVRPVDLNPAIWEAYSDPSITNDEFEAIVRRAYGDEPDCADARREGEL